LNGERLHSISNATQPVNVIATPQPGYMGRENHELYYRIVVDQILAYTAGNPVNALNPEAMGRKFT
jgi:D-3-phosphoglycerate dehydrogenase / 2-oxoglutarate reductase